MKAEIILSSNLPSKTCFVIQKLQKKIFSNLCKNFITKHVMDGKFELRMISAFI